MFYPKLYVLLGLKSQAARRHPALRLMERTEICGGPDVAHSGVTTAVRSLPVEMAEEAREENMKILKGS